MIHGKSIRLFLVDGNPSGILTAEIVNWTGHVLSAPRSKLVDLMQREECQKTGIYFLISENSEPPFYPNVYIGESDDVAKRLEQHNRDDAKGGKSFWEKVCLITSKDQNLTKAHIRYLEKRLIELSKESGRCQLENGTEGFSKVLLPESDISAMEYFIEQISVLMPVLGYEFLRVRKSISQIFDNDLMTNHVVERDKLNQFYIKSDTLKIDALAVENDGEFTVLKGSRISRRVASASRDQGYSKTLRPYLLDQNIVDKESFIFLQDYTFKSASASAAIVLGRQANGRLEWKNIKTGLSYADQQEQAIQEIMQDRS